MSLIEEETHSFFFVFFFLEIRNKGVGYFKLSMDEMERQKQLKELHQLREDTLKEREKQQILSKKRTSTIEARLERLKEKKLKYEAAIILETKTP